MPVPAALVGEEELLGWVVCVPPPAPLGVGVLVAHCVAATLLLLQGEAVRGWLPVALALL